MTAIIIKYVTPIIINYVTPIIINYVTPIIIKCVTPISIKCVIPLIIKSHSGHNFIGLTVAIHYFFFNDVSLQYSVMST